MKILKHGDLQPRKFACTKCHCEFVADMTEYYAREYDYPLGDRGINYHATCPDCKREVIKDSKQAPLYKDTDDKFQNIIERLENCLYYNVADYDYNAYTELCGIVRRLVEWREEK